MLTERCKIVLHELLRRSVIARRRRHRIRKILRKVIRPAALRRVNVELEPLISLAKFTDLEAPFVILPIILYFSEMLIVRIKWSQRA